MDEFELIDLLDSGNVVHIIKRRMYIVGYIGPNSKLVSKFFNIVRKNISQYNKYSANFDEFQKFLSSEEYEIFSKDEFDNLILLEKIL